MTKIHNSGLFFHLWTLSLEKCINTPNCEILHSMLRYLGSPEPYLCPFRLLMAFVLLLETKASVSMLVHVCHDVYYIEFFLGISNGEMAESLYI